MADINLAAALYPDLASAAPAPAPEPAPAAPDDRSTAEKIYGSEPVDGLAKAREGIEAGKAKPASEVAAEAEAAPVEAGPFGLAAGPLADKYSALVKETGLNEAGAARMVALHREALTDASTTYWEQTGKEWQRQTLRQFPGAQLDAAVGPVKALLADRSLTTPGFVDLLGRYKLGNNPDIVRTLANWARAMGRRR